MLVAMECVLHGLLWLAVFCRVTTLAAVAVNGVIRKSNRDTAERNDYLLFLPLGLAFLLDVVGGLAGVVAASLVTDLGEKLLLGSLGSALLIFFAVVIALQYRPIR